eukprot:TRINITY_DN40430_c0_g1_i2.p1 TRINITY_DN40430_c0_g1~~TRINITY_DN40430_c0_g1_i2.p1  ORF type:complete len:417 (-),score=40.96 TRINITY_DN40430_c0_g1_i2:610-1860(-)
MALGAALTETSICERMARRLCYGSSSTMDFLFRLHCCGAFLALIVPSQMVRVQIVLPLGLELISSCGCAKLSKEASAIILSLVVSTNHIGTGLMTGTLPNILAFNALHAHGVSISWSEWLVAMAPVFTLGSFLVSLFTACCLFGRTHLLAAGASRGTPVPIAPAEPIAAEPPNSPPAKSMGAAAVEEGSRDSGSLATSESRPPPSLPKWTTAEVQVMIIFALVFVAWATDRAHGIQPVYIGLIGVLLMYFPKFGPLQVIVWRSKVNFSVIVLLIGVLAASTAILDSRSLLDAMSDAMMKWLLSCPEEIRTVIVFLIAMAVALLINATVSIAIFVPFLCSGVAASAGMDPLLATFATVAMQNICFFPFQCAPLLVACSAAKDVLDKRCVLQVLALNSTLTLFVLVPLAFGWWHVLGY